MKRTITALLLAALATPAAAWHLPRKYDRTVPRDLEERRRWNEERQVLRINGLRGVPFDCQFVLLDPSGEYVADNLALLCRPLTARPLE